jgi:hypothetical protein
LFESINISDSTDIILHATNLILFLLSAFFDVKQIARPKATPLAVLQNFKTSMGEH